MLLFVAKNDKKIGSLSVGMRVEGGDCGYTIYTKTIGGPLTPYHTYPKISARTF